MPFLHDRHERSAFPFSRAASQDAGMTSTADLRLRGGLRAQVTWPRSAERPPLLVLVAGEPRIARELADRLPAVVLAVGDDGAREALEWGADHAAELGAAPDRTLVAGPHRVATAVAALARQARDRGWPPIATALLFDPAATAVEPLAGLFRIAARLPAATRAGTPAASVPAGPAPAPGPAPPPAGPP
jgi:hypothetical protein